MHPISSVLRLSSLRPLVWSLTVGLLAVLSAGIQAAEVDLRVDPDCPQAVFAASEIEAALAARDVTAARSERSNADAPARIVLTLDRNEAIEAPQNLEEEGFAIRVAQDGARTTYSVVGHDPGGLMYGGLELAEQIRIGGLEGVKPCVQNPYMPMRGTKFNIPLDVRTPSYTDVCDSAQKNIPVMWDFEFWKEYIDNLARYRYNYVSLWSLHPFPSMVRVPGYEDIALDDVQRSTVEWKETYSLNGKGFDAPEILDNVEVVKEMSIDEKIAFWKKVMRYAKERNIDFYVITWNIFVNGTDGKYGITDDIDNPITTDYFRKSVREMFLTYPDLAGVGLTTGENMHGASSAEKEGWAFATYGQGVLDAAALQPEREFRLIHRQHQTGASQVIDRFKPLVDAENVDFIFSFKYAKAHVMSSTTQNYHHGFVEDIREAGIKTVWTLRNDDNYHYRWGAPDFVREFIRNVPHDVSQGFYYGSDQWIWGREILSLAPATPREVEIKKHWYHWTLWGRLGYDPNLSNERLIAILAARYPEVPADKLFEAWQNASMIYPRVTGFHWGSLDFQWYIEACKSQPGPAQTESGFHDVNRFITLRPHPGTDYISIPEYVKAAVEFKGIPGKTPIEIADTIDAHADAAMETLRSFPPVENKELDRTLTDIATMARLGKYYAAKIRGATGLAMYRVTEKPEYQTQAVAALTRAAEHWRRYTSLAAKHYKNPLWTNRVGYVDWNALTEQVEKDIEIARGAK